MVRTIVFIIWLEFEVNQLICFHLDHLDIVQCHCTPKQYILINHRIKEPWSELTDSHATLLYYLVQHIPRIPPLFRPNTGEFEAKREEKTPNE